MSGDDWTARLRAREAFRAFGGHLRGEPVTPWRSAREGKRWEQGSMVRLFAGALPGTAGVIGAGELPDTGELDIAPAMGLALFEASYIVYSYATPIAWWLGPEVHGAGDGEWIEVAERCNEDYGRFSKTTTKHQNMVHAALTEVGEGAAI